MLDTDTLKYLSPDEARQAREFEQMFSSAGWKALMESVATQYERAKELCIRSETWEQNRMAFGRMTAYGDLWNFEDDVLTGYNQIAAERQAEEDQKAEDVSLEYE